MSRKNNTRSIKAIQDREAQRIDMRRRVEQRIGRPQDAIHQGKGWNFIPATSEPASANYITRDRK